MGSGPENNRLVPEMQGGRMQAGGSPTGHRGSDPDWNPNVALATISHIMVIPSLPKYVCGFVDLIGSSRIE